MSTVAKLWLCSDAADVSRSALQANVGDFLFNQSTSQLMIAGAAGALAPNIPAGALPAASPTAIGGIKEAAAVTALTDSTGGTVSSTLAAITAGASYAQADMVAAKNAIASLNAQINTLMTAMVNAGQMA